MDTTLDSLRVTNLEEEQQKNDNRLKAQIESGKDVFDVKVDLLQYMRQTVFVERSKTRIEHKFGFKDIQKQDALLMQVPNINESGYYSGIIALRSWVNKFNPELKVEVIDPVIDYFYIKPPDKKSDFFNLFNTYSEQSKYWLLNQFPEMGEIVEFISLYIDKAEPKILGFSIIDGNIDATLALAKLTKKKYPNLKIVLGGNGVEVLEFGRLPNTNYKISGYTGFIDAISRGDGEMTFVDLIKSDWSEESLMKIDGLIWQLNGVFIHNRMRQNIDMDKLPMPDYSPLEDNYYYKSVYGDTVPLVMSRGCPYRCSFCSVPDYIPEFRYRSLEGVMEEIKHWVAKGKTFFFCHDSIINGNPRWFKAFCERLIEEDLNISFGGNMRLQEPMRNIENMRLYRKAGLHKMITGFESYSEPVLKHMKKYTDVKGVREIFENVRQINKENPHLPLKMQFGMQLIVGYLNEGREDFLKTMQFVEEFKDCIQEIVTCSAFLIHQPLVYRWRDDEGQYLEYINGVNFSTKWNTPMDRLNWLNEAEETFKRIGVPYSIYNRGLYLELKDKLEKETPTPIVEVKEIETKDIIVENVMISEDNVIKRSLI